MSLVLLCHLQSNDQKCLLLIGTFVQYVECIKHEETCNIWKSVWIAGLESSQFYLYQTELEEEKEGATEKAFSFKLPIII